MNPQAQLMSFLTAKRIPPVIGALAQLQVADHLAGAPLPADELAERSGAHPRSLDRLLRAAASVGVFAEDGEGRFALTPMAELLRSDVPGSLRSVAVMFALEPFWSPYGTIMHSVLTGEPVFDRRFGMSAYEYLGTHPQDAAIFGEAAAAFHATPSVQTRPHRDAGCCRRRRPHGVGVDPAAELGRTPDRFESIACNDRFTLLEAFRA